MSKNEHEQSAHTIFVQRRVTNDFATIVNKLLTELLRQRIPTTRLSKSIHNDIKQENVRVALVGVDLVDVALNEL